MSSMFQISGRLKLSHLNLLEDYGSDLIVDKRAKQNRLEELINLEDFLTQFAIFFLNIFKMFPTIKNSRMIIVVFKILLATQLLYQIFELPLLVSFPQNSVNIFSESHPILRLWFVLPFIVEIILNFNLTYYQHGERITSKFLIIDRYLKKDFWWDLTGVLGSSFIFENTNLIIILIIFVLRFVKFKTMYDSIEEKF